MPGQRRFPLHVHISALFILLLVLAGGALGLFNYRQTTAIIFSSSATLFDHIQEDLKRDISATYQPIRHLLGALAFADGVQGRDLERRLALLPAFAQALRDNPTLDALHLGYANGDFLMLRALRTRAIQQRFDAPPGAAFQLWSIEGPGAARRGEYRYFDDQLHMLERRPLGPQAFDPRQRQWYRLALQQAAAVTTMPYLFFSSRVIGTTLARPTAGQAVVAADLTLEALSATLLKHKITASSEVLLFDGSGRAVAYADSQRLVIDHPQPHRARVSELLPELSAALEGLGAGEHTRQVLELHKRRWVISREHVSEGGPDGLYIALLVPEDELLADAYRIRWQGALITLTALLLCLPLGWLVSRCITRPLAALQRHSEAMGRLDFRGAGGVRSAVLEVDALAQAMTHAERTLVHYHGIVAELGRPAPLAQSMQAIARGTLAALHAQVAIIYLLQDEYLRPCTMELAADLHVPLRAELQPYDRHSLSLPEWLQQALAEGSAARFLGFDQAGDLQPVLHALDSPMVSLLAVALHDEQMHTWGILLLLQRAEPLAETAPDLFSEPRVAFARAVAGLGGRHLAGRGAAQGSRMIDG